MIKAPRQQAGAFLRCGVILGEGGFRVTCRQDEPSVGVPESSFAIVVQSDNRGSAFREDCRQGLCISEVVTLWSNTE